ncbi:mitochondrial 54S ribosomal protein img2 [Coemansia sp. RSA 2337]|nr:mitochondrial 54S ribosomal protein img2 [Coemansia sp. S17]KAJ2018089.1 mitochondrial 54S ribosomal protein img2 [Coemansia sp. S680]KAJ2032928.1 mitochondrial 54S ribosomal protein img2 [Coemansia sp. S3946]KAJ2072011.1 mitochondrial 54S ribosomal protein img2 [Coemansia sp. S155-1]KAJ2341775.1 mitochondrial 54S ribosomal protein img2 [Coemansia sp. RSA 2673]KAJ2466557.1 mitochondrial 54S ribosomal protein img2 [Coemansia sp. RSA 2337]
MFCAISSRHLQLARVVPGTFARAYESTLAAADTAASSSGPQLVTYPYFVHRTRFQSLPVYTDVKNGKTRKLTIVRRIEGDLEALRSDMSKALSDSTIQIKKASQQLVIKGERSDEVRAWLTRSGF